MTLKQLSDTISAQYVNIPVHARPRRSFSDKTANGLTKAILAFMELKGIKAWRQGSEGRFIQGREYTSQTTGRTQREKGMYIPRAGGGTGIGDICAVIRGRFITIEVKIGRDRQSPEQIKFQKEVEASGGVYLIAKSWVGFIEKIKPFVI